MRSDRLIRDFCIHVDLANGSQHLNVESQHAALSVADILSAHGILLNTKCGRQGTCDGCQLELVNGEVVDLDTGSRLQSARDGVLFRGCRSQLVPGDEISIRVPSRSVAVYEPSATTEFTIRVPYVQAPLFEGHLAAAVDVGTTSVSVAIVDLHNGKILAVHSARNAQMRCGMDVLSRIAHCQHERQAIVELQHAVCRETIRPLLSQCLNELDIASPELSGMTIAANTVMLHLLAGEDPTSLGHAPFTPVFLNHRVLRAGEMGLDCRGFAADRPVHLLPASGAYIGADIVAGAIATGLAYRNRPSILLDLGTNGEIIFKHQDRVLACATASGPAFEGAGLTCGMVAGQGAICGVRLTTTPPSIKLDMIGGEQPRGICGSAYVDLLAEGRRTGLIDGFGRLRFDDAPEFAPWADCVDEQTALRLAVDPNRQAIVLTEGDIASLQQAKAAIAAGTLTLLEQCGVEAGDVSEALVAGAFGAHLDSDHAVDIGLLPEGFRGRTEAVGNTSLAGAYLLAMDRNFLDDLNKFAERVEVVELNSYEHFQSLFIDELLLP